MYQHVLVTNNSTYKSIKKSTWKFVIHKSPSQWATWIVLYRSKNTNCAHHNKIILDHSAWMACQYGKLKLFQSLVNHGANINYTKYNNSCLDMAMMNGHVDIVKELLSITMDWSNGRTSIMYRAAMYGQVKVVQLLLTYKVDVNEKSSTRATPIWIASKLGHTDVVKVLLNNGADCDCQTHSGSSPIYVASAFGHLQIVKLLRAHCANVNVCSYAYPPPLHAAIKNNFVNIAMILMEYNCGKTCQAICVALGLQIHYHQHVGYITHQSINQLYQKRLHRNIFQTIPKYLLKYCIEFVVPPALVADSRQTHHGISPIILAIKHNNSVIAQMVKMHDTANIDAS